MCARACRIRGSKYPATPSGSSPNEDKPRHEKQTTMGNNRQCEPWACSRGSATKGMRRTRLDLCDPVLPTLNAFLDLWQYISNSVSIVFQYSLWVLPAVYLKPRTGRSSVNYNSESTSGQPIVAGRRRWHRQSFTVRNERGDRSRKPVSRSVPFDGRQLRNQKGKDRSSMSQTEPRLSLPTAEPHTEAGNLTRKYYVQDQ